MANGNILRLTECRRSDSKLFDFYSSVLASELTIATLAQRASKLFNFQGPVRFHICISHAKRVSINRRENLKEAVGKEFLLPLVAPKQKAARNSQQDMMLFEGLELFGVTEHASNRGVKSGCLYTIEHLARLNDCIKIQGIEKPFKLQEIQRFFRLSYARTYASCQGCEFDCAVCLSDTQHPKFSKRHLYVGLSRCKDAGLVRLEK